MKTHKKAQAAKAHRPSRAAIIINGEPTTVYRVVKSHDVACFDPKMFRAKTELWLAEGKVVVSEEYGGPRADLSRTENIAHHQIVAIESKSPLGRRTCASRAHCDNGRSYAVTCQMRPYKNFEQDMLGDAVFRAQVVKSLTALNRRPRIQSLERKGPAKRNCPTCGWEHDPQFTQILIPGRKPITLRGVQPDIVACVHKAHEEGSTRLSSKDDELQRVCAGYQHPCKAFADLKCRGEYKLLFDTSRRGFISLRGQPRNKSQ